MSGTRPKVVFFANTDWYLANFQMSLASELERRGLEVVMVSPPGPFVERLTSAGFRWIEIPMQRRSLNPLREGLLVYRLLQIYRRERPDIAHHFTIKCVVYGGLVTRVMRNTAVVASITGLGYVFASTSWLARLLKPFVSGLMQLAISGPQSRVIVQNADDRDLIVSSFNVQRNAVRLIGGSGVNTQRFTPAETRSTPERQRVLLASRLLWEKGLGEYAEAARMLKLRGYNAAFLLAGTQDPGNPHSVPEQQLREWHEEGIIEPLGHVDDMAALLRSSHVVVLPSFYREGIPRTLLEAAATGLPVVTTDAPGCREAVEDGVTGFLVPVRNATALADAIGKLLDDSTAAARMGDAGRQRVLRLFDQRLVFDGVASLYGELLQAAARPLPQLTEPDSRKAYDG